MTRAQRAPPSQFSSRSKSHTAREKCGMANGRAAPSREKNAPQNRIWLVKARENIALPPRCSQIVVGKLEIGKEQTLPLVCMEPAQIHVKGIFLARTLTRVGTSAHSTFQVTSQRGHADIDLSNCAYVMLANFSEEHCT